MNLFGLYQSFMGCMYPGSIRTESIESMDHEQPDCRFAVANIDERYNEVSRGELQLTDKDLIYFRPSRHPTRWPLCSIRRYGCTERPQGNIFIFESGRRCLTGQAIFAFRLIRGADLLERLKEKIDRFPLNETNIEPYPNDETMTNPRSNRLSSEAASSKQLSESNHYVPSHPTSYDSNESRRDASTSTDNPAVNVDLLGDYDAQGPKPLSYALIDFDTTKALNESAQAHAASRAR